MLKDDFDTWVTALKSGKYKQDYDALNTGIGFCCLGVLCDVMQGKYSISWVPDTDGETSNKIAVYTEHKDVDTNYKFLPFLFMKRMGLTTELCNRLINKNDVERKSFDEIATFLTEHENKIVK